MIDIHLVADEADMIINGYAFTAAGERVRVLNLNRPEKALVMKDDSTVLETTMDDIETEIARSYYLSNRQYMECSYA